MKQMEQGNAICISDCRSIQDTENDIKIWELICLNHIQKIQKIVPGCENSDVNPNYYDMIRIMISSSVITDGDRVNLSEKFMAGVVMFSKKRVALTIIAEIVEADLVASFGTTLNLELFNRLRRLAKERLDQLS